MIAFANNNNKVFSVECQYCKKVYDILLNEKDFDKWQSGDCYIQECLHYLTAAERELLISATCDNCWKNLYGEDLDDKD